jgi:WD40 repeat protein
MIWYLESNNLIFRKKLHQARITDIAVDPSGNHIATASTDGRVYILDTRNLNQPPFEITSLDEFIFSVEFMNNGRTLIVGNNSINTLIAYPTEMDDLAKFICPNVTRNMTQSEWTGYIGQDIPYENTCNR